MRDAASAWDEGAAALQAGRPAEAREHFQRAHELRPDDATPVAWEARALADEGKLEEAVDLLGELLQRYPGFAEARYNRAAYLARLGRVEEAAPELRLAIDQGATTSRAVLLDPDFQPWLDHPTMRFLPREYLRVAVELPEGPVFLGNQVDLRLRVVGVDEPPVRVEVPAQQAGVVVVRVVEEVLASSHGPEHDITWTLAAVGEGTWTLGPMDVEVGPHRSRVGPVTLEVAARPGHTTEPALHAVELTTPGVLGAKAEVPSVSAWGPDGLVHTGPADRVELLPPAQARPVLYEYRERGEPLWTVHRYPGQRVEGVRVIRAGETVFEVTRDSP